MIKQVQCLTIRKQRNSSMSIVISIPYIESITDRFSDLSEIDFYQAVSIPVLQGGKEPRIVGNTVIDLATATKLIERFGSRFKVLANSCFPQWNQEVSTLCEVLQANRGAIVVSRIDFARKIKNSFPDIVLYSSVIMNFYESIHHILETGLFDVVGGSQFYNDDTDKMISEIPLQYRHKVMYLLLGCVWSRQCIRHYELPSLQWQYPTVIQEIFQDSECTGRPGFNVEFEKLLDAGFKMFKFGYRTPTVEQAEKTISTYLNRYYDWKMKHGI